MYIICLEPLKKIDRVQSLRNTEGTWIALQLPDWQKIAISTVYHGRLEAIGRILGV